MKNTRKQNKSFYYIDFYKIKLSGLVHFTENDVIERRVQSMIFLVVFGGGESTISSDTGPRTSVRPQCVAWLMEQGSDKLTLLTFTKVAGNVDPFVCGKWEQPKEKMRETGGVVCDREIKTYLAFESTVYSFTAKPIVLLYLF